MLFTVRANSLQILALVLNGNTQHANHRLLTARVCLYGVFLSESFLFANKLESKQMNGLYSSCLRWCHATRYLSVCEHVFFFCLRVPKTPLNPANLNSTEMVRIIRVWIGASVGSRYAGWLMIPTPAASWLTPDCPSNIYCSSPPSTHPSWRWFRAYHKPGNRCQTPTSLPPVLFDSVSSHLRLSSLFLFTFCSFLLPAPVLSPPSFFFLVLPKNHFTSLRLSL